MSGEIDRIRGQLERAFSGEAWHGPSLSELLTGVDARQASARPIAGVHTIHELVRHIIAWQEEAVRRLRGGGRKLPDEEDWPASTDWIETLDRLRTSHLSLKSAISALDDSRLDEEVMDDGQSIYVLLHGVVQHNLYHAGQIALLKKAGPRASRSPSGRG